MALRHIVTKEDSILHKVCREQVKFDSRLHQLPRHDMAGKRLENANGVGLAAPAGRHIAAVLFLVIETNVEDEDDEEILELINPVIVSSEGEQTGAEGCLSVPGEYGIVTRPSIVTVRAQDRDGNWFEYKGTGLTARCICHELDHLDGHLFTEKCERMLSEDEIKGSGSEG